MHLNCTTLSPSRHRSILTEAGDDKSPQLQRPIMPLTPLVFTWAGKVALRAEYGDARNGLLRWGQNPKIFIKSSNPELRAIILAVIDHINNVLIDTNVQLEIVKTKEQATLKVITAPLKSLPTISKFHKFPYVEGNWGYFYYYKKSPHEIDRAFVLLAEDLADKGDDTFRHFALEEITQSLGLANDADEIEDSVFFAKGNRGGNAQWLSPEDQILLKALYKLPLGSTVDELFKALKETWPGVLAAFNNSHTNHATKANHESFRFD